MANKLTCVIISIIYLIFYFSFMMVLFAEKGVKVGKEGFKEKIGQQDVKIGA